MKISRATFLKLMAGMSALFSLVSCRRMRPIPENFHRVSVKPDLKLFEEEIAIASKNTPTNENLVRISRPGAHPKFPHADVRFGMAIDLEKCNGCGKCALACMVENNVPRVNEDESKRGRFMHWLEMRGDIPVMCAHCGDAPCEKVCPTGAAVASPDGFSAMVYPRCIGTRFCGANCPLHARKFNYTSAEENGFAYKFNAEVPLRPQGVMEKCSLCIQRLQNARIRAKTWGENWDGSGVKTACAEAGPNRAIICGNWLDADSELVRATRGRILYAPKAIADFSPAVVYLLGKL